MKNFKTLGGSVAALAVFLLLVLPTVSSAWKPGDPLVPCTVAKDCNFNMLMKLIDNMITFTLKFLALPIAAIMFAYAGILLVTAGGGEAKTKAKSIFFNTVLGLIIAVGAWLIVATILAILGYEDASWIGIKIDI